MDGRYLAYPIERYFEMETFGDFNRAWFAAAEQLAETALRGALDRAALTVDELGAIFFVTVTGVASPTIDARLANRMRFPPAIKRIPIFGLGCVAGAAGIARAADYVKAYPAQIAAVVSVELCSLTLQKTDLSVANLISSGLFGDGAAAVLVGGSEIPRTGPRVVGSQSCFYPDTEDVMGWEINEKGFRIVLSPEVPAVIRKHLPGDAGRFLKAHGLTPQDIGTWILHTGGPKVLEATQDALGITQMDLQASWQCLRTVGNLSSASVLCVLEEFMGNKRPLPGTWSLLAAMGPGFCSELVLLQW